MTDNQFDNFIRAKLHDHSAPVPAGLWDKVNPAKDDDERKGGILLPKKYRWGWALLLLIGSVTGYLIFSNPFDSQQSSISSAQRNTAATTSITPTEPSSSNNEQANSGTASTIATQEADIKQENNTAVTTTESGTKRSDITPAKNNSDWITEKKNKPQAFPKTNSSETSNTLAHQVQVKNNNRKFGPEYVEAMPAFTKSNGQPTLRSVEAFQQSITQESNLTKDDLSFDYPMTFSNKLDGGNIVSMDRLQYGLKGWQGDQISSAYSKKFKNVIVCPPFKGGNTDWFVEVYATPELAFKSIENISATPQYLQKKDSSETMRLGYSGGVRLVKPITDNFLVKAGLQYTQINEKFTYRTENEVRTTTVISVRTIIRGPGDTLRIADTSTVLQTGFKNNTIKNRYRSFDIPVTLGYQFGNDNLQFGVNAGVVFNISSWYQGVILDSSMTAVPIVKGGNSIYKNNIGLGLYGGFSILKRVGEDTQLFFEPYFRYNLSGITNEQSSFKQRFSLGGLSIGLRYNLNRR